MATKQSTKVSIENEKIKNSTSKSNETMEKDEISQVDSNDTNVLKNSSENKETKSSNVKAKSRKVIGDLDILADTVRSMASTSDASDDLNSSTSSPGADNVPSIGDVLEQLIVQLLLDKPDMTGEEVYNAVKESEKDDSTAITIEVISQHVAVYRKRMQRIHLAKESGEIEDPESNTVPMEDQADHSSTVVDATGQEAMDIQENNLQNTGTVGEVEKSTQNSGRPRKTTELIDKIIMETVRTNQKCTAKHIQSELKRIYDIDVSCETIRRRVKVSTKQRLKEKAESTQQEDDLNASSMNENNYNIGSVDGEKENEGDGLEPKAKKLKTNHDLSNTNVENASGSTPATVNSESNDVEMGTVKKERSRRKAYSLETRQHCVQLHSEGLGYRRIGTDLQMPHTTVRAIIEKEQRTGSVHRAPRSGRPRKTDELVDRVILQTVKTNQHSSARVIQEQLLKTYNVQVSCETIRRRVKAYSRRRHAGGTADGDPSLELGETIGNPVVPDMVTQAIMNNAQLQCLPTETSSTFGNDQTITQSLDVQESTSTVPNVNTNAEEANSDPYSSSQVIQL